MRDPIVELGIGIMGQAIRDWRLESKAHNYKLKTAEMKKIDQFLRGDLANLIGQQLDLDPKVLLKNLKKENRRKWLEYEKALLEREGKDGKGEHSDGGETAEQRTAVCKDSAATRQVPVRVCNKDARRK